MRMSCICTSVLARAVASRNGVDSSAGGLTAGKAPACLCGRVASKDGNMLMRELGLLDMLLDLR